jgi:hypothetical protein
MEVGLIQLSPDGVVGDGVSVREGVPERESVGDDGAVGN